jgi:hypothetical protein
MGTEIRTKGGQLIGNISDTSDGEDYLIVDNKRVMYIVIKN